MANEGTISSDQINISVEKKKLIVVRDCKGPVRKTTCLGTPSFCKQDPLAETFLELSPEVFFKKGILKNFAKFTGNTCSRVFFLIKLHKVACNFIKKETLVQVFSREFYETFKNTFFHSTHPVAASEFVSKITAASELL